MEQARRPLRRQHPEKPADHLPRRGLEDADPGERASILAALPRAARVVWPTIGRLIYARHIRAVRDQNTAE